MTDEDREQSAWTSASLKFMDGRLPLVNMFSSRGEVDAAISRLSDARAWVDTIENQHMRKACRSWCDYAQKQIDEAERELAPETQAMRQRISNELDEVEARAREILKDIK